MQLIRAAVDASRSIVTKLLFNRFSYYHVYSLVSMFSFIGYTFEQIIETSFIRLLEFIVNAMCNDNNEIGFRDKGIRIYIIISVTIKAGHKFRETFYLALSLSRYYRLRIPVESSTRHAYSVGNSIRNTLLPFFESCYLHPTIY